MIGALLTCSRDGYFVLASDIRFLVFFLRIVAGVANMLHSNPVGSYSQIFFFFFFFSIFT